MIASKVKLALVAVGFGVVTIGWIIQHQRANRLQVEKTAWESLLVQLTSDLETAQQGASIASNTAVRLKSAELELLRLRGTVARWNREKSNDRPLPQAEPIASTPEESTARIRPPISPIEARLASGQTLVAGGWDWTEGRRGVLSMTPVSRPLEDGQRGVEMDSHIVVLTRDAMEKLGLSKLGATDNPPAENSILDEASTAALLAKLKDHSGVEQIGNPKLLTRSGDASQVAISSDDLGEKIVFHLRTSVNTEGKIDVSLSGEMQPWIPPSDQK